MYPNLYPKTTVFHFSTSVTDKDILLLQVDTALDGGDSEMFKQLTNELKEIIQADILSSFSLRERTCYILHEGQKMSMAKIADELGISKGTVQGYIEKARKKVRKSRFE